MDEEAIDAGDLRVVLVCDSSRCEAASDRREVGDDEPRVGLARRGEALLDANVQLLRTGTEPAAAAAPDRLGFRELLHPEQFPVERPRLVVAPGRCRHLHVIDPQNRHPESSTIAGWPVELEDTLVGGYRRLAAETPRRRIDLELRTLDILFATIFGLGLLPVGVVIALAILLTSGWPVVYRGERVGRGGHFFDMVKFRTLQRDAETRLGPYLGAELVRRTEAEYTRIGRWLKASQLDEIPQLWNVLKGDMSFVGPRPIRARFFAELASELPAYWQRLVVRPGLTGFAQVRRGYETSMAEKLAHDLEWIADRSVRLYLRTLAGTGFRVLGQTFRGGSGNT